MQYVQKDSLEIMMKKKFVTATLVCVAAMSIFVRCTKNDGKNIGNEKAKTIALADVALEEDEVTKLNVSKNEDNVRIVYEVDFTVSSTGVQYDYEISV